MSEDFRIPGDFQKSIKDLIGSESVSFFESLRTSSPSSIRINPYKNFDFTDSIDIPWSKWGKYLRERPIYTLDPSLHAGAYYVQEPSSMFLEQVITHAIDPNKTITALDLCAAPGGKSTHLLSLINSESLLVSNEVIHSRASVLSENIQKWGYPNVLVTNNDPAHFSKLEGVFDLIIVDAPCSGEGLFRKDHNALSEWSLSNIELCSLRQRRILKDIWPALKQNGILIYCTCTYNTQENEEAMEWLSQVGDVEFLSIPLQPEWGIVEEQYKNVIGYRFYPHKVQGEGFFISALRKREHQNEIRIQTEETLAEAPKEEREISNWVRDSANFKFVKDKKLICAIPKSSFTKIEFFTHKLNTILIGTLLATNKHGKLVPEHGSALSIHLDDSNFTNLELNLEQAIQYLRKDTLVLDSTEKGFALVSYKKNVLGWVNLLANRINNIYPTNWRIRMRSNDAVKINQ